jgi:glycine cleavage system H protein
MEGFTYNDIFDTKGIEYIIIIAFLFLLIPFWIILNKGAIIKAELQKALQVLTAGILRVPQGYFFSRNHTWAYLEKSGNAKIGMDDFLVQITGELKILNLKKPGDAVSKGDILTEISQNGKLLKIYSPLTGLVLNTNPLVLKNPGILNQDPYENGWIYDIRPSKWMKEMSNSYLADKATEWLRLELERFKDFVALSSAKSSPESQIVVFQEGGELRTNPLSELNSEIWKDFQREFLDVKD